MAETTSTAPKPFRAIVVGGGIVGLSLSHAFQLANIDHIVLEKHDKIISARGAALLIWPGVARIFDQFGLLDKIHKSTTPMMNEYRRWPDGSIQVVGHAIKKLNKIFETETVLFDRQACVTHLYEGLPDKSRIHTGRRLVRIEHTKTGVVVHLSDGTMEEGDIVVGADGVHSHCRLKMWDYASTFEAGAILESDKVAFFTEFAGLFGVSTWNDSLGLSLSESNIIHGQDQTKLLFTQPGKIYWAIVFKDGYSRPPKNRSTTEADILALAHQFADIPFTETITFRQLWDTRLSCGLLNIEEGILDKWHAGRIVLAGDSAFKMTADVGVGANIAIESAITLGNIFHRELKSNPNRHFSNTEIAALFTEYQNERFERSKAFVGLSGRVTRMHTYQTRFGKFFVSYIAPYLANVNAMKFAESFAKAPKLDYVPVRTLNEDAQGWQLANKKRKTVGAGWLASVLTTSVIGVAIAYVAITRL